MDRAQEQLRLDIAALAGREDLPRVLAHLEAAVVESIIANRPDGTLERERQQANLCDRLRAVRDIKNMLSNGTVPSQRKVEFV
ncbi:MAG: hypothetical protein HC923_00265 [Myxococcales bacterium]|nr:hypothetical protein [Myxococcales bacterium]